MSSASIRATISWPPRARGRARPEPDVGVHHHQPRGTGLRLARSAIVAASSSGLEPSWTSTTSAGAGSACDRGLRGLAQEAGVVTGVGRQQQAERPARLEQVGGASPGGEEHVGVVRGAVRSPVGPGPAPCAASSGRPSARTCAPSDVRWRRRSPSPPASAARRGGYPDVARPVEEPLPGSAVEPNTWSCAPRRWRRRGPRPRMTRWSSSRRSTGSSRRRRPRSTTSASHMIETKDAERIGTQPTARAASLSAGGAGLARRGVHRCRGRRSRPPCWPGPPPGPRSRRVRRRPAPPRPSTWGRCRRRGADQVGLVGQRPLDPDGEAPHRRCSRRGARRRGPRRTRAAARWCRRSTRCPPRPIRR